MFLKAQIVQKQKLNEVLEIAYYCREQLIYKYTIFATLIVIKNLSNH
mgnify:CR=1 FL=1